MPYISVLDECLRVDHSCLQRQASHQQFGKLQTRVFFIYAYSLHFSQNTFLPHAVLSKLCAVKSRGVAQQ